MAKQGSNPTWGQERISTIEELAQRASNAKKAYAEFMADADFAAKRKEAHALLTTKQTLEAELVKEVEQETGILPFDDGAHAG
jgi:hypothetical protein